MIWEIIRLYINIDIGYLLAQGEGVGSDAQQRGVAMHPMHPIVGWIMVDPFRNVQDILVCLYEKLFPHRTGIARSRLEPGGAMVGLCWIYMGKPNFVDGSCLTILLVMALEMEPFAFLRPSSMVGYHPKLQSWLRRTLSHCPKTNKSPHLGPQTKSSCTKHY